MPEPADNEVLRADLLEHPAAKAWGELRPGRVEPHRIEILRGRRKAARKKAVYRLEGVGPGGSAVIAKCCPRATGCVERAVYADILPHLPLSGLSCYGFVEEPDSGFCWIFLEDAGPEKYSPLCEEHRRLAGCWLGLLHTSAERLAATAGLPDRGPGHYRERLRSVCEALQRHLADPALPAESGRVLKSLNRQCEVLAAHWGRVEEFCGAMPRTLVHGDFIKKNLRLRTGPAGTVLLPFDWELAGWGVPAVDVGASADPDRAAYGAVVQSHWPGLHGQALRRLAQTGEVFRSLAGLDWAVQDLQYKGVKGR